MTNKENDQTNKVAFDASVQSLITEYNGVRQASLSRDDAISKLDNFVMVILAAALASYLKLIDEQYYVAFPLISIVITSITFTRRLHKAILNKLARYEKSLSDKITRLLSSSAELDIPTVPFEDINQLWGWQSYYEETDAFDRERGRGAKTKRRRLKDAVIRGGVEITLVSASLGFLVLYLLNNNDLEEWCWAETTVLIAASLYSLLLITEYGKDLSEMLDSLKKATQKS